MYQLDTESWNLIFLLGKEGEEGLDDGQLPQPNYAHLQALNVRGETIYIC